jgi:hypothetical protein
MPQKVIKDKVAIQVRDKIQASIILSLRLQMTFALRESELSTAMMKMREMASGLGPVTLAKVTTRLIVMPNWFALSSGGIRKDTNNRGLV